MGQKNGLKIINPNENMSRSYIKMAEESIDMLPEAVRRSRIWTATVSYYIFYYSLYSLMLRIGVKCEIHACSLEFMKSFLNDFYNKKDIEMIEKAFNARISLQYYADRPVDSRRIEDVQKYCKDFYIRTKDIISGISEAEIKSIRNSIRSV